MNDPADKLVSVGIGALVCVAMLAMSNATVVVSASGSKVKDADIRCDGTDDEKEIQAAVDSLGADGGLVLLSEGAFNIDGAVRIEKDNVTIAGTGRGTVIAAANSKTNGFEIHNRTGITLRDMRLHGANKEAGDGNGIGVNIRKSTLCLLQNLWLDEWGAQNAGAIFMVESAQNKISGCHVERNIWRGINLWMSPENLITHCTGKENGREFIFLNTDCADSVISACHSTGDGTGPAVAIAVYNNSNRSIVTGCTIRNATREQNLEISYSNDCVVSGNTLSGGNWEGILVVNAPRTVVTGNTISGNRLGGIVLRKVIFDIHGDPAPDGCIISNNVIAENDTKKTGNKPAISIESGNNTLITNNQLVDNHAPALVISPGVEGTRFIDNTLTGTHKGLVADAGKGTEYRGNVGYPTEASGEAAIPSGLKQVAVKHGLVGIPRTVSLTPLANTGPYWISSRTSDTFIIELAEPPMHKIEFLWTASY